MVVEHFHLLVPSYVGTALRYTGTMIPYLTLSTALRLSAYGKLDVALAVPRLSTVGGWLLVHYPEL